MKTGDSASITRAFGACDVDDYAGLAGYTPPQGEVPEPLINALYSCLLGVKLPGRGTNYLKQSSRFQRLPRVDEPLTATVTVTRLRPDKHLVDLKTECRDSDGELLCEGRALVYVEDTDTDLQGAAHR